MGGKFLAVGWVSCEAAIAGATEIAALDEDAGDFGVAGEAQAAADQAAVIFFGGAGGAHGALQAGGEAVAVDPPVISFGPAHMGGAAVEMDADEHRVTSLVGEGDPIIEFDEVVVIAKQDDFESAEFGLDAFGHVEGEVLFLIACVGAVGAWVLAAVAGIDDDGFEIFGTWAVAPVVAAGRRGCVRGARSDKEGDDWKAGGEFECEAHWLGDL